MLERSIGFNEVKKNTLFNDDFFSFTHTVELVIQKVADLPLPASAEKIKTFLDSEEGIEFSGKVENLLNEFDRLAKRNNEYSSWMMSWQSKLTENQLKYLNEKKVDLDKSWDFTASRFSYKSMIAAQRMTLKDDKTRKALYVLYTESVPTISMLLTALASDQYPIHIRKNVTKELLFIFRDSLCHPDLHNQITLQYEKLMSSVNLNIEFMVHRKQLLTQSLLSLIQKKYSDKTSNNTYIEPILEEHYVNHVLNKIRTEMSISFSKDENIVTINPAIANKLLAEFKECIKKEFTLDKIIKQFLPTLYPDKNIESLPGELKRSAHPFEQQLDKYGKDAYFKITDIIDEESTLEENYKLTPDAEEQLIISLLHRLNASNYLSLEESQKNISLNGDKIFLLPNNSLKLAYVINDKNERIPFITYLINAFNKNQPTHLDNILDFMLKYIRQNRWYAELLSDKKITDDHRIKLRAYLSKQKIYTNTLPNIYNAVFKEIEDAYQFNEEWLYLNKTNQQILLNLFTSKELHALFSDKDKLANSLMMLGREDFALLLRRLDKENIKKILSKNQEIKEFLSHFFSSNKASDSQKIGWFLQEVDLSALIDNDLNRLIELFSYTPTITEKKALITYYGAEKFRNSISDMKKVATIINKNEDPEADRFILDQLGPEKLTDLTVDFAHVLLCVRKSYSYNIDTYLNKLIDRKKLISSLNNNLELISLFQALKRKNKIQAISTIFSLLSKEKLDAFLDNIGNIKNILYFLAEAEKTIFLNSVSIEKLRFLITKKENLCQLLTVLGKENQQYLLEQLGQEKVFGLLSKNKSVKQALNNLKQDSDTNYYDALLIQIIRIYKNQKSILPSTTISRLFFKPEKRTEKLKLIDKVENAVLSGKLTFFTSAKTTGEDSQLQKGTLKKIKKAALRPFDLS